MYYAYMRIQYTAMISTIMLVPDLVVMYHQLLGVLPTGTGAGLLPQTACFAFGLPMSLERICKDIVVNGSATLKFSIFTTDQLMSIVSLSMSIDHQGLEGAPYDMDCDRCGKEMSTGAPVLGVRLQICEMATWRC